MREILRPHFDWHLRSRTLPLGERTVLMGILNVTPDSFSDGGVFLHPDAALTGALRMFDDGADILDLGGESTRPGSTPLSSSEEQARVLPVLTAVLRARPDAIISIDTYHAETARLAIEAGAEIVNDVSGHLWDARMSETCARLRCGAVLMHTRGRPQDWRAQPALEPAEVAPLVLRGLAQRVQAAEAAGIAGGRIALDPGFGFGKVFDENYTLLAELSTFRALKFPLLAGLSRKSFLKKSRHTPAHAGSADQRGGSDEACDGLAASTEAANAAALLAGAHILRVHAVAPARATAETIDRIMLAASALPLRPAS